MSQRSHSWWRLLAVPLVLSMPHVARAQAAEPKARNMPELEFVPVPGLPTCAPGAVESGDPTKGPSIILAKQGAGCVIPWHWHTPNEHLMMISGEARVEVKNGKPFTLLAGGFGLMPSKHVHQARCITPCTLFVYSDAAFDLHYVDPQGKEISPREALKAVGETAAQAVK